MPVLGVAEHSRAGGQDFITRAGPRLRGLSADVGRGTTPGFDCANFCCMGAALGAGKLLASSRRQLAECLSMAVVPNNALNQARTGHLSMWKAVAAGQAGRAGVFAAMLAQAGMKGPHAPFEGKAGWCNHVARKSFFAGDLRRARHAFQDRRHAHQAARVLRDDDLVDPRGGKSRRDDRGCRGDRESLRGSLRSARRPVWGPASTTGIRIRAKLRITAFRMSSRLQSSISAMSVVLRRCAALESGAARIAAED